MTHIMLDLETWGTDPGCDLRSIGAVVFKPDIGYIDHDREFYVATSGGEHYGLTRDPKTEQWWSEQSTEAQAAFANPVDISVGLAMFTDWLGPPDDLRIWAHGPVFDISILAAAYKAVGSWIPWHYRAPRDTRTVFDVAGIINHSKWLDEHATGTVHNALDDAICQARAVCDAWEEIRTS